MTLTVKELCRSANYTLVVSFGVKKSDTNYCDLKDNMVMTRVDVKPGEPHEFKVDSSILQIESGQSYCYIGVLEDRWGRTLQSKFSNVPSVNIV